MQTALITGGTRGIGFGIAREFARTGINLALNGIREKTDVMPVLEELRKFKIKVEYFRGDISKKNERIHILDRVLAKFISLNILVNNAGVGPEKRQDILESSESSFDRVLGINLKGPYFLTKLVANYMIRMKQKDKSFDGCIINISSVSATMASTDRGDYCISKAGIAMSTKLWAVRLGEFGIPVYEIRPGIIQTDMTSAVHEKYDKLFKAGTAIQNRWGQPEDIGKVAASLVTGCMPYSTGQVVMVDGGMTIQKL